MQSASKNDRYLTSLETGLIFWSISQHQMLLVPCMLVTCQVVKRSHTSSKTSSKTLHRIVLSWSSTLLITKLLHFVNSDFHSQSGANKSGKIGCRSTTRYIKAATLVVEVQRDIFHCKKTLGLRRIPLNWVKWLLFLSDEDEEVQR